MGIRRRFRPAPIKIIRKRQEPAATEEGGEPDSPESPDSPGMSSASSIDSSDSEAEGSEGEEEEEEEEAPSPTATEAVAAPAVSESGAPAAISSSAPVASIAPMPAASTSQPPPPPPASSSSAAPAASSQPPPPMWSASAAATISSQPAPAASSASSSAIASTLVTSIRPFPSAQPNQAATGPGPAIDADEGEPPDSPASSVGSSPPSSPTASESPSASQSGASGEPTSSVGGSTSAPEPTGAPSAAAPTSSTPADQTAISTNLGPTPSGSTGSTNPQPDMAGPGISEGQTQRVDQKSNQMSKGAEATLITLSVLGFVVALAAAVFFFLRRRRRRTEASHRHASDAFNPDNTGSLHTPSNAHITTTASYDPHAQHMTQSSTNTTSLFGAAHYVRPDTVSTSDAQSRIGKPQPTPNPFADPGRNKAFDQIRGRPRSTTLTDRGSWVDNPFKDPLSDRFDPFGELHEKARAERVRYREELEREKAQGGGV